MIKRLCGHSGESEVGGSVEHCIIETEDLQIRSFGKILKSSVELVEVAPETILIFLKHGPRRFRIRFAQNPSRFRPRQKSA